MEHFKNEIVNVLIWNKKNWKKRFTSCAQEWIVFFSPSTLYLHPSPLSLFPGILVCISCEVADFKSGTSGRELYPDIRKTPENIHSKIQIDKHSSLIDLKIKFHWYIAWILLYRGWMVISGYTWGNVFPERHFYWHNFDKEDPDKHPGVVSHKTALTIPIFQHFPLPDKKYFGKCDFCDLWEEAWKGRAEGSEWHRKSVFVMLKCVGVFMWAVLERKNERKCLQTVAGRSWMREAQSLYETLISTEYPVLGLLKQLLTAEAQYIKEKFDIGLRQN